MPLPPPTQESRKNDVAVLAKARDVALRGVRSARATHHKGLRAAQLAKTVRPDDLRQAEKEMEKLVEKGNADTKEIVNAAKRALEG